MASTAIPEITSADKARPPSLQSLQPVLKKSLQSLLQTTAMKPMDAEYQGQVPTGTEAHRFHK